MDNGFNNGYNNNMMPQNNGKAPGYTLWLVLGIIQICSVCCCNVIMCVLGILTVVFAVGANKAYLMNDYNTFKSKIKTAKVLNIVGWALGVASIVIGLFSGVLSLITESMNF